MSIATLLFALLATSAGQTSAGSTEPLMLDFTATWCGPCRQMKPAVERLVQDGYPIKAVDVDQSPDLAAKYRVSGIPAFVVIDPTSGRELARSEGAQPAANLVSLFTEARAKARSQDRAGDEEKDQSADDEEERPRRKAAASPNPKPWETVVRIKVHGKGSIGFGSGTIVHSTPEESIILTCAHIFKMDGRKQAAPAQFPLKITIDLFDGNRSGPKMNQVHYTNETFEGEALDYDFGRDVGLIRIRPGRRLPYARVVPTHWKPEGRMGMITVGCSEGHDATAWDTVITNPAMKGLNGNGAYEAIECMVAPKQGRSGGGLFTSDGYVAGVCDFAEPRGNHGLYASPQSIYSILDRNDLMALYAPVRPGKPDTLLAKNQGPPKRNRGEGLRARGQSPRPDDPGALTMPSPEMLGIKPPIVTVSDTPKRGRQSWQSSTAGSQALSGAEPVDMKADPSLDSDKFGTTEPTASLENTIEEEPVKAAPRVSGGKWKAVRTAVPEVSGGN